MALLASGKNTYVREHSHEGDLLLILMHCIRQSQDLSSHDHDENLIGYVYDARDALLNRVLDKGHTQTVWIIHSAPTKADRRKIR